MEDEIFTLKKIERYCTNFDYCLIVLTSENNLGYQGRFLNNGSILFQLSYLNYSYVLKKRLIINRFRDFETTISSGVRDLFLRAYDIHTHRQGTQHEYSYTNTKIISNSVKIF